MKVIETEYNGYRFRSRLEARWAVFFDEIGADYEYEPEGFILKDGTKYLPDFLVHNVRGRGVHGGPGDMYVEVKGVLTPEDLHKIELFEMPIIIFGRLPDVKWMEGRDEILTFRNGRTEKEYRDYAFWSYDFHDLTQTFFYLDYSEGDHYMTEPKAGKCGGLVLDYPDNPYDFVDDDKTARAYIKAKQARFEHGENGIK